MWLTLLYLIVAIVFACITASTLFHLQWMHRLPELHPNALPSASESYFACSVVIAARDEAHRIEETVTRLLRQRLVELEIIVVDDRSTDQTHEILLRLSQQHECLHVLRVDELPSGWLGKCNACYLGANLARKDWILFTDADCWIKPDVVARALQVAAFAEVAHITLTPGIHAESAGPRAWHLAFLITLSNWFSGVNRDRPKAYLGMGAFNLIQTEAYRKCGGYEALRMTVLDDVRMGLLLRRAGYRTRAYIGGDDVECHWGANIRDMIKIMEKNYFAAADFQLVSVVVASAGAFLFWIAAILGPFIGGVAGFVACIAMLSLYVPAQILATRLCWSRASAVLTPLIFPALFYAALRSAWITTLNGGICWRDTFYPIKELRKGIRTFNGMS